MSKRHIIITIVVVLVVCVGSIIGSVSVASADTYYGTSGQYAIISYNRHTERYPLKGSSYFNDGYSLISISTDLSMPDLDYVGVDGYSFTAQKGYGDFVTFTVNLDPIFAVADPAYIEIGFSSPRDTLVNIGLFDFTTSQHITLRDYSSLYDNPCILLVDIDSNYIGSYNDYNQSLIIWCYFQGESQLYCDIDLTLTFGTDNMVDTLANYNMRLQNNYDYGYTIGRNVGYNDGYSIGRDEGYDSGYQAGTDYGYDIGYNAGTDYGYDIGYNAGVTDTGQYTFTSLIGSVIDVPINTISSMLDFNLLGTNLRALVITLFSLALVIAVVRLIL